MSTFIWHSYWIMFVSYVYSTRLQEKWIGFKVSARQKLGPWPLSVASLKPTSTCQHLDLPCATLQPHARKRRHNFSCCQQKKAKKEKKKKKRCDCSESTIWSNRSGTQGAEQKNHEKAASSMAPKSYPSLEGVASKTTTRLPLLATIFGTNQIWLIYFSIQ